MATRYWVGGDGAWNDTSHWSTLSGGAGGASAPSASDDVIFDNMVGALFSPILLSNDVSIRSYAGYGPYVTLDCSNTYRLTVKGDCYAFRLAFTKPPSDGYPLIIDGNSVLSYLEGQVQGVRITSGTTTLGTSFQPYFPTHGLILEGTGGIDLAGQDYTAPDFVCGTLGSVTLGTGVITITGTGNAWVIDSSGIFSGNSGTIKFTNISAAARTFSGGDRTYGTVWFSGAYIGIVTITGSNTFGELRSDTGQHSIQFTAGTTQTITVVTLNGASAAAKTTLRSTTNGSAWYLLKSSGIVACEWLDLKDSHAAGGAMFNATNTVDGGGNMGWSISTPPALPSGNRVSRLTYLRR